MNRQEELRRVAMLHGIYTDMSSPSSIFSAIISKPGEPASRLLSLYAGSASQAIERFIKVLDVPGVENGLYEQWATDCLVRPMAPSGSREFVPLHPTLTAAYHVLACMAINAKMRMDWSGGFLVRMDAFGEAEVEVVRGITLELYGYVHSAFPASANPFRHVLNAFIPSTLPEAPRRPFYVQ